MQPKTANKRDRLAARLTRGSQPGRARVAGPRFSKGDVDRVPAPPLEYMRDDVLELEEQDVTDDADSKGG